MFDNNQTPVIYYLNTDIKLKYPQTFYLIYQNIMTDHTDTVLKKSNPTALDGQSPKTYISNVIYICMSREECTGAGFSMHIKKLFRTTI